MAERVFITGDKHGTFYPLFGLAEKERLDKTDILIIAGDAGYVWDEDYVYKVETLNQLFPGTVAFIDGNHENHDLLDDMESVEWMGGQAHMVGDRVYHMLRGEIYSIYGDNYFTFGGARSNDKDRREEGKSWWKNEEPSKAEIERGAAKLAENLDAIDYVITHEPPESARPFMRRSKPLDADYTFPRLLEEWYEMISGGKRFKKWYFGHMHEDKVITPKLRALHNDIVTVGGEEAMRWA